MKRVAVALALVTASAASAQPRPAAFAEVGLDEQLGAQVPLALEFSDIVGRRVELRSLFADRTPVVLVLTYVRCKTLCSLVLRGSVDVVRELPLELGRDYRVVMISIDPTEDAASAAARHREIVTQLGRPSAEGWTYLVGAERTIRTLADSVGFRYAVDRRSDQIAHPAALIILTPSGRVSRYLQGVQFSAEELATALRDASAERISATSIAQLVLDCFRFDPAQRAHREQIERYLRVGGAGVMLTLGSSVVLLFLWERRRRRSR